MESDMDTLPSAQQTKALIKGILDDRKAETLTLTPKSQRRQMRLAQKAAAAAEELAKITVQLTAFYAKQ